MLRTFGQQLRHFANAADIVKDDEFTTVLDTVREYIAQYFIDKVELVVESVISGQPALTPTLDPDDAYGTYPVFDEDDKPNGLNAFAFVEGKPLWVVADDESELERAEHVSDHWSKILEVPRYRRMERDGSGPVLDARTLISIPLKRERHTWGVLYCESKRALAPSDRLKAELDDLALGVATLYELKVQNEIRHRNTQRAISQLKGAINRRVPSTVKPILFLAYSKERDTNVMSVVRSEIDKFSERVEVVDWEVASEPGEITQQLVDKISSADHLVAYLSEPLSGGSEDGQVYQDNANVLYEAGLFHGAAHAKSDGEVEAVWLPIREAPPPALPFDFKTVNVVEVPRIADGKLNEDEFRSNLGGLLEKLLTD